MDQPKRKPEVERPVVSRQTLNQLFNWIKHHKIRTAVISIVVILLGILYAILISDRIDDNQAQERLILQEKQRVALAEVQRIQRTADVYETITFLCNKINELPLKIGEWLALSDARRRLLGVTTTTLPPQTLSPEEIEILVELDRTISERFQELGTPVDCSLPPLPEVPRLEPKP